MRILMLFCLGFAASCALGVYVLPEGWLIPAAVIMGLMCVPMALLRKKSRAFRILLVLLIGAVCGALRFQHYQTVMIQPARELDGCVMDMSFTASGRPRETAYGYSVEGHTRIAGTEHKVRVYLDEDPGMEPGEIFGGTFRMRYAAPKEGEKTSYLQTTGIFLVADQRGRLSELGKAEDMWRYVPAWIGQSIKDILKKAFPEDVFPFIKAVLLGDASELGYELDTALKMSGIRHIVAVSGLHVSILCAFVDKLTGKRRFLTVLLGLPVLLLFAAVVGFTPSVTRACVMAGIMLVGRLLDKEYDAPTALSFACFCMLVADPVLISSVSLQLSAGCVAGILIFQPPIRAWIDKRIHNVEKKEKTKLKSWFSSSVAVTLGAMILTTPLSAYYFGTVSIIGILTNLLTLWVLTFLFIGIILTCLVGLLWMPLATWMGWLLAWPARYVMQTAKLLSKVPFAAVYTASGYIIAWLVLCYVLLLAVVIGKGRGAKPAVAIMVLSLLLAVGCSWAEPLLHSCTVTVLDVGQGQSLIVQTEGKTFLVDCGGPAATSVADTAAEKLLSMGIPRVDAVILTHGDTDHTSGLGYLLTRVDTDLILLPATEGDLTFPDAEAQVLWIDRQTLLTFGNARITVYPPAFSSNANENSLCILFDTEKYDILVTGDRSERSERVLIAKYAIPEVDLLIAGHHGAEDSTGEALLRAASPATVVISVGKGNRYGHPSPELLERLDLFGCSVLRTDRDGTIVIRR